MGDVALHAGVAKITVSRYLREPDTVASETGIRIQQAIDAVGYIPNFVAGSLSSNRTRVIAAVLPTLENTHLARTLMATSRVLDACGLYLMVRNCGAMATEEEKVIKTLIAQRPAGLILHSARHTRKTIRLIESLRIPTVETGDLRPGGQLDMMVSYSNYSAARAMVTHLIDRGYRNIGFLNVPVESGNNSGERLRGFRAALKAAGLPYRPEHIRYSAMSFKQSARAFSDLVDQHPEVDAIFCTHDIMAAGALFECQRRGWPVPARMAIAGFDDYDIADQVIPALTTVAIQREEIGRRAAEMIAARVRGETIDEPRVDVGFKIIERDSA